MPYSENYHGVEFQEQYESNPINEIEKHLECYGLWEGKGRGIELIEEVSVDTQIWKYKGKYFSVHHSCTVPECTSNVYEVEKVWMPVEW